MNIYTCYKCDMNMWSDEILENKTCEHEFPFQFLDTNVELSPSETL